MRGFAASRRPFTFGFQLLPKGRNQWGAAMRTVIFDLDGTLMDTSGDLIDAANVCFSALGLGDVLDRDRDEDRGVAVKGGKAMLRAGFARAGQFGEPEVEDNYRAVLEAYGKSIDRHTTIYPGAMEAIARLAGAGYAVGICTNKPEGLAETLLTRMGVRNTFASMIGADTLATRKPDAEPFREAVRRAGGDPARACLIGDTVTDLDTARAAGVPCILVDFGPGEGDVLSLSPDVVIGHHDDLFDAVEALAL